MNCICSCHDIFSTKQNKHCMNCGCKRERIEDSFHERNSEDEDFEGK